MRLFGISNTQNGQGIILINGFSTSTNDYLSLYPYLTKFQRVELVHFPSDINENDDKVDIRYDVWLSSTLSKIEEVRRTTNYVVLVGFSNGAIPACYLAQIAKVDRLILISPVFRYQSFDDNVENIFLPVKSNNVNRFSSNQTLKTIGSFLRNPIRSWRLFKKTNLSKINEQQTILSFPLFNLFDEGANIIDSALSKLSEWAKGKKKEQNSSEYGAKNELVVIEDDNIPNKRIFKNMVKQLSKIMPDEFKNLSSQSVMNILRLLSYCDHNFDAVNCPTLIYYGLKDDALKDVDIKKITSRIKNDALKVIAYPSNEHNLLGSIYSEDICNEVIRFASKSR
jgi:esterase/lipase